MALTRWQPPQPDTTDSTDALSLRTAITRGLFGHCPSCGQGKMFASWLRVVPECSVCGAPLGQARSDDLPPYITIFIVAHIVVPLMLWLERAQSPQTWVMAAVFVPMTLFLTLVLMGPVKGGTVGLMLKLGMVKAEPDRA